MKTLLFIITLLSITCIFPVQADDIFFNTSVIGDRNLGQEYTWSVQNVSGLADITYHFEVYAFRDLGKNYTYRSKFWGKWFQQSAHPGKKYYVIWVRGWTEGTTWIGWGPDRFNLWLWGNTTIKPLPTHMEDMPIKYKSEKYLPVVIAELEHRNGPDGLLLSTEWYGWRDGKELDRTEPGRSNAFDGVILYEVPDAATPEEIRICGWFGFYGYGLWYLTPHTITQNSWERAKFADEQLIKMQKKIGLRLSDSISRGAA